MELAVKSKVKFVVSVIALSLPLFINAFSFSSGLQTEEMILNLLVFLVAPNILFAILCPFESFFRSFKKLIWFSIIQLVLIFGLPFVLDPYFLGFGGGMILFVIFFILSLSLLVYFQISLFKKIIRSSPSRATKFICWSILIAFLFELLKIVFNEFLWEQIANNVFYLKYIVSVIFSPLFLIDSSVNFFHPLVEANFSYLTAQHLWFIISPLLTLAAFSLLAWILSLFFRPKTAGE